MIRFFSEQSVYTYDIVDINIKLSRSLFCFGVNSKTTFTNDVYYKIDLDYYIDIYDSTISFRFFSLYLYARRTDHRVENN